ncbi:iron complex transport system substrate-binding protein [Bosea lathyri]|uniref:Iron complex transport system substrate-binding protein n=2 Tax=Bosea lathyri TaxID=1036778 RepID=A0A1H5SRP9_9HYPH|nr:iron complex transport system substrate-binding protein [Bosea lathyri]
MVSSGGADAGVCIPIAPQRIVALDPALTMGILQELGAPVVGAPLSAIQEPFVREAARRSSVSDVGHPLQPSIERIIALKPDLIVGSAEMHGRMRDSASRIAPTLLIDQMDWTRQYRLLAEITGHSDKAQAALDEYEKRVAEIRARVTAAPVSVVRVRPSGFHVYLDGPSAYAPYAVLREAGVTRTAYETTSDGAVLKRPDWEEISALEGEVLLYVVVSGFDPAPDDALAASTVANPLWKMLPAVQTGRAHRVDRATWMGFHGIASAHRVLDDVERFVLKVP